MTTNTAWVGGHHGGSLNKKPHAQPWNSSNLHQGLKRQGHELVPITTFKQNSSPITADALHEALVTVVDGAAITHPHGAARENHHHNLEALQAKRRWQKSS